MEATTIVTMIATMIVMMALPVVSTKEEMAVARISTKLIATVDSRKEVATSKGLTTTRGKEDIRSKEDTKETVANRKILSTRKVTKEEDTRTTTMVAATSRTTQDTGRISHRTGVIIRIEKTVIITARINALIMTRVSSNIKTRTTKKAHINASRCSERKMEMKTSRSLSIHSAMKSNQSLRLLNLSNLHWVSSPQDSISLYQNPSR
jgi:hypothetical protein